ncbi:tail sheath protein [Vibrio phage Va2]|nr:tail sheath protein [Vibrio phage Va2]
MSSAKVLIAEIDKSSYIPESNGVYGAMVMPLVRGATDEVGFATSEEQFLSQTTPEGRIEPGMDLAYYQGLDFLRGSNKLLYVRVANGATFGGVTIPKAGSNKSPKRLPETLTDPLAYTFDADELFLLHATSEGDWSRHVGYRILPYTKVKNAFVIEVYFKTKKAETWIVSRDPSAKDGSNRNIYIENVLRQSQYVNCIDNKAIANDVLPVYLERTTTTWAAPVLEQAYSAQKPAEPKHESLVMPEGNFLSTYMPLNIAGVPFLADPGADKVSLGADAATADFSLAENVEVLTAQDGKVDIYYTLESKSTATAGDFMTPSSDSSLLISYTSRSAQASATAATETWTVDANNGANKQYVVVEGVVILIEANATADAIATAVAAKSDDIVKANPQLESVTAATTNIVFTYKITEEYKRPVRLTVGASIRTNGSQVIQSYSPGIGGTSQVFTISVTSNAMSTGNVVVSTDLKDISTTVEAGQTSLLIAQAIGESFNSDADFSASVTSTTVTVTFNAVGRRNAATVDAGSTGVSTTVQTVTTGKDAQAAVLKKTALTLTSGNEWNANVTVNICDQPITLTSTVTTASAAATAIAGSEDWSSNPIIDSVVAQGDKLIFTFSDETKGKEDLKAFSGLTKLVRTPVSLVSDYREVEAAKPAKFELRFTGGNTSSKTEILYVNSVPVVIKTDSNTPAKVVTDLISANVAAFIPGLASVDVSSKDPRTVVFTFDISSGAVSTLEVSSGANHAMTNGGGVNGAPVTDTQMIKGLDLLKNRTYNVSMDAGWTTPSFQRALASQAEAKKDHIAILSVPYEKEAAANYIDEIISYRTTELNLDTTYAALFTGHFKIRDKFNDRDLWIAPSGGVGALASNTITNYEPWHPFAGSQRGKISWPTDVRRHFEEGEMDLLQENQINPILFDPGKGIKLWGQMTLQSFPSSLDRINVRLLAIYVEVAMKDFLSTILFELNDEDTRNRVVASADKFMESVKARKGVYAFKNVCDETNNTEQDVENNRLVFQQYFEPVKSIEVIRYEPIIMNKGSI